MPSDKIIRVESTAIISTKPLTENEAARVRNLVNEAWSKNTRRAYAWGWRVFEEWCVRNDVRPLPADPLRVALFIEDRLSSDPSAASIRTQLSAIRWIHEMAGFVSPTAHPAVKLAWKSAARKLGTGAKNPKAPATMDVLRQIIRKIDRSTVEGKRDAAMILVGFHGAFRRSEIAAMMPHHFRFVPGGISIFLPRSKTDQAGEGETVGIARHGGETCAIDALSAWSEVRLLGPTMFGVRPAQVASIVKRYAKASGFDPRLFAGHSLRAGFVTEAFRRGAGEVEIMGSTRHKSATTLARYRREADPIRRGASGRMKDD